VERVARVSVRSARVVARSARVIARAGVARVFRAATKRGTHVSPCVARVLLHIAHVLHRRARVSLWGARGFSVFGSRLSGAKTRRAENLLVAARGSDGALVSDNFFLLRRAVVAERRKVA